MPQPSLADHARRAVVKAHLRFHAPPQFLLMPTPGASTPFGYVDLCKIPYEHVMWSVQRILAYEDNRYVREYVFVGPMIDEHKRNVLALIWVKDGQAPQAWHWKIDTLEDGTYQLGAFSSMADLVSESSPIMNLLPPRLLN
jgi:hypothetical protein